MEATAHAPMPLPTPTSEPPTWQELQGSKSWEGLLDPLQADLRASLMAYGELAEAAYDGLNMDKNSTHAGSCLYKPAGLLAASGVSHPEHYTLTKFLYANCGWGQSPATKSMAAAPNEAFFVLPVEPLRVKGVWKENNWIGYVAVATEEGKAWLGRRDIVVAWRGTVQPGEKASDVDARMVPAGTVLGDWQPLLANPEVHRGFLSVYSAKDENSIDNSTSAQDQAMKEVQNLMQKHEGEEMSITVTGHSLGAALASLNALDIVAHRVNINSKHQRSPVTAILFASPRVGDVNYRRAFNSFHDLRALHVKNKNDKVPWLLPDTYIDEATATLHIDTDRSPYLRPRSSIVDWDYFLRCHNLECYLHSLAGDHGEGRRFNFVVDRDLELINKGTNALRDEYPVPAAWWVANNKYRIKGVVGRWKLERFTDK